ncbi:hypothetical protein [Microcoleus anatoxicus]|nr:MAG: hypothetical protein EAZ96_24220 [Oscillatoriales cyanobacterium]TAF32237.1 MAG: hypothetical protein EAZ68_21115 [Oscillatoriales cyanobacterium]
MYSYRIIMLGPRNSGKTVYLGSMFHKLSGQGEWGFFLEIDGEKRKKLNGIYTEVATETKWPPGTDRNEISEWVFTCSINRNGTKYSACQFVYLDYAGGRITEAEMEGGSDFDQKIKSADVLLGLLDGAKICALMRQEREGVVWVINELQNMLNIMTGGIGKPVHFVISKWDIVESSGYSLKQVREKLLESSDAFQNLVTTRKQDRSLTRLIPVSSLGKGFAKPLPGGGMEKILGKLPKPFQVEVPLACVLPDMIQNQQKELAKRGSEVSNRSTKVEADLSGREKFSQNLPGWFKTFPGIKNWAGSAEQKTREAAERSDELRRQKADALNKISDETSALASVLSSFNSIQNQLYISFPDSDLSS